MNDSTPSQLLPFLRPDPTKFLNTLKQFVLELFVGHSMPTNCLDVIDNFVGTDLKWLSPLKNLSIEN